MAMHEIETPIAIYRTGNVEMKSHIAFGTPCLLTQHNGDCLFKLEIASHIAVCSSSFAIDCMTWLISIVFGLGI